MKKFISLIVTGILLVSCLASCGGTDHAAAAALDEALGAIKSGDFASAAILDSSAFANEDAAMLNAMYKNFDYKLGEVTETEGGATVAATITMTNVGEVFSSYLTEAMENAADSGWDADDTRFVEMLTEDGAPISTIDVNVAMVNTDGVWTVSAENEELLNAITGGLFSALGDLAESLS